jgi:hypothetical protein
MIYDTMSSLVDTVSRVRFRLHLHDTRRMGFASVTASPVGVIDLTADVASERVGEALQRLEDTVREIRDHASTTHDQAIRSIAPHNNPQSERCGWSAYTRSRTVCVHVARPALHSTACQP